MLNETIIKTTLLTLGIPSQLTYGWIIFIKEFRIRLPVAMLRLFDNYKLLLLNDKSASSNKLYTNLKIYWTLISMTEG